MARFRSLAVLAGIALAAVALVTPAAQARTSIDAVASALRTDPVYNDPSAENALSPGQADDLRGQVAATGLPIYIAILPASAATEAGSADTLLRSLRDAVGREGVYAVIAGNAFRAGSTSGSVTAIADDAFQAQASNGPFAVLEAFVSGVDAQYNDSGQPADTSSSGGGSWVGLIILLVVLAGIALVVVFGVRAARRSRAKQLVTIRGTLDEDVTSLGEQLAAFDVADPRLDDAGRADLQAALDAYSRASDASSTAKSDADITRATSELEAGRYALACVQARVDGRALPQRRPPCFVDPRHGPSESDVMWAPDGGAPHPVPVCAACAATLQSGAAPQPREVMAGGQRVPYWRAGADYAPYARGYYSSFADALPMIFVGTMLASAFMPSVSGISTAGPSGGASDGGGSGFGGGGDFGGGGFGHGGGDFGGGGGFGGGDFG